MGDSTPRIPAPWWALIALALLWAPATLADPVVTRTDDGVIDWTHREVRATGVGTPRILSPTGALTPREPYDVARADAEARIERLLARLPVDAKRRLREVDALDAQRAAATRAFTGDESRHFSDGTVHLPARASFAWVADGWPAEAKRTANGAAGEPAPPIVGPPAPGPSGLIIELSGPVEPAVRLRLEPKGGAPIHAGTARDPIGPRGVVWARAGDGIDRTAIVGDAPVTISGQPGGERGVIALAADALPTASLPGAVLVLLPLEKP